LDFFEFEQYGLCVPVVHNASLKWGNANLLRFIFVIVMILCRNGN
jgi:hypothetical protein